MNELIVGLGERAYPIHIETGCLANIGKDLAERRIAKRYCVISDSQVAGLFGEAVLRSLARNNIKAELVTFAAGEEHKNPATFASLCSSLAQMGFDRKDGIIALGGGVTGDLAGFVAASYMRGIPFVQIPTTLLSQVDSSVGGKTGVDIAEGKNLVGAFYQPKAVYIDSSVLATLGREELLGGMAEVIKYGVIRDAAFFQYLGDKRTEALALDREVIEKIILTSCSIKADVVKEDEYESNIRRILNYGHTIGHAVEAVSNFSIIHGKAVAIGMAAAAALAVEKGVLAVEDEKEILALLKAYGLPTEIPAQLDRTLIKQYLLRDKKIVSGRVAYVLPVRIGEVIITDEIEESLVEGVLAR
jgi:3-dehydroquinate synthase